MINDQLIPNYREIRRWWSGMLALLGGFCYHFYRGHVSCHDTAYPRYGGEGQRALSDEGAEVCFYPECPGQLGKDFWMELHLIFTKGSLVSCTVSSAVSFTSLKHCTPVAVGFLPRLRRNFEFAFRSSQQLTLGDTPSLWGSSFWAASLSVRTTARDKALCTVTITAGLQAGPAEVKSPPRKGVFLNSPNRVSCYLCLVDLSAASAQLVGFPPLLEHLQGKGTVLQQQPIFLLLYYFCLP